MKKNRGFSLVELIVAIAIMSILISLVGVSLSILYAHRVSTAASDSKSLIQAAQTIAMSKDNCCVQFTVNGDGDVEITSFSSATKELDSVVVPDDISVTLKLDGADTVVNSGGTYQLKFVRESGAFSTVVVNGVDSGQYCSKVTFTKGEKRIVLELSRLTGKVSYGN